MYHGLSTEGLLFVSGRRMRFWQSSSLHIWTQLHYIFIEYSPSVWVANIQKTVTKQLTCDLTLSKLTCTAHGNSLFHWTLLNLLSPTSRNEKITYVYILKAKNSTPNLTSHRHPQVKLIARVSPAHHVSVWTQDLFVVPGTQKGSVPLNGHHPAPNPFRHTAWKTPKKLHNLKLCQNNATLFWRYIACQKSQHTLKLRQNNATLFWGYIACQKVRHTLKWCKSNATLFWGYIACHKVRHTLKWCKSNETLFWGYIACKKVRHTLKLCKNNAPTCAGLTRTSDSNSTLNRCQQAGRNFFGRQYISNGSLLQTVQTYPLLLFSLTAQLGHILVVPKHKNFVSYYKRFGRVMDTNRPRLCLLVSITGGKCIWQEPIFLSGHHPSNCQKLREGIRRCGYCGRL